jgi:hypothetical protein
MSTRQIVPTELNRSPVRARLDLYLLLSNLPLERHRSWYKLSVIIICRRCSIFCLPITPPHIALSSKQRDMDHLRRNRTQSSRGVLAIIKDGFRAGTTCSDLAICPTGNHPGQIKRIRGCPASCGVSIL